LGCRGERLSLFISFEGGEGSGKSTQAEILAERLAKLGVEVLFIHEPGSTELGWYVRDWLKRGLKHERTISHNAELFLFSAARSELVTKVIRPALEERNVIVIADRYVDSTTAYQGFGRGIPKQSLDIINNLATQDLMPDLTFFLDCSPEEGLRRLGAFQLKLPLELIEFPKTNQNERDQEGARFEEETIDFHERVRQGYLEIARNEPQRICKIDGTKSIEEISELVWRYTISKVPFLPEENISSSLFDASIPANAEFNNKES
jgi:dTMP kinase